MAYQYGASRRPQSRFRNLSRAQLEQALSQAHRRLRSARYDREHQAAKEVEAALGKVEKAQRRARMAERELSQTEKFALNSYLRLNELEIDENAHKKQLQELEERRDYWRREADRLSRLKGVEAEPEHKDSLEYHDSLISRCKCGAWVYNARLCSYHRELQEMVA